MIEISQRSQQIVAAHGVSYATSTTSDGRARAVASGTCCDGEIRECIVTGGSGDTAASTTDAAISLWYSSVSGFPVAI